MFDGVVRELKELGEVDFSALTPEELDEAVVAFAKVAAQVDAVGAELHRVWESEKTWTLDGSRSPRAWLAKRTRNDIRDCGKRIWLGKTLLEMPLAAAAFAAGEISSDHIRRLKDVLNPRTAEAFCRDEALLVGWAQNRATSSTSATSWPCGSWRTTPTGAPSATRIAGVAATSG